MFPLPRKPEPTDQQEGLSVFITWVPDQAFFEETCEEDETGLKYQLRVL